MNAKAPAGLEERKARASAWFAEVRDRLVTALEESGYVRRHADPRDARASTLAITPLGQDTLERLRTESTLVLAASLQLLTAGQRSTLAAVTVASDHIHAEKVLRSVENEAAEMTGAAAAAAAPR